MEALEVGVGVVDGDVEEVAEDEDKVEEDVDEAEFVELAELGNGENDSDTLGIARLQNCCETPSAEARSPGHVGVTHSTRVLINDVALEGQGLVTAGALTFSTYLLQKQSTSTTLSHPIWAMDATKQLLTRKDTLRHMFDIQE